MENPASEKKEQNRGEGREREEIRMNTAQSNMIEKHPNFTPNETNPCVNYSPETRSSISNTFPLYPPTKHSIYPVSVPQDQITTVQSASLCHFISLMPTQILLHSCRSVFVLMVLYNSLMT